MLSERKILWVTHAMLFICRGKTIPKVVYSDEETNIWGQVYSSVKAHHKQWACQEYLNGFKLLEKHCGYSRDSIPQLQTVSSFLKGT